MLGSKRIPIPIEISKQRGMVIADGTLVENNNGSVGLTIVLEVGGDTAKDLITLLNSGEPQALRFGPVPANPRLFKYKENI